MARKSYMERDVYIYINSGVEPRVLFIFKLNLRLIDSDTIWFIGEVLVVVVGVGLVPVVDRGLASFDAEPLTEILILH